MFEFHAFAIFLEKNATLEESFLEKMFFAKFPNEIVPSSQTKTCQVPKQKLAKFPNEIVPNSQMVT